MMKTPAQYRVEEYQRSRQAGETAVRLATNDNLSLEKRLDLLKQLRQLTDGAYEDPTGLETCFEAEKMLHSLIQKQAANSTFHTAPITISKSWQEGEEADPRHWYLEGVVSSTNVDRDGDAFSSAAISQMAQTLNNQLPVFLDHEHSLKDSVGVVTEAQVKDDKLYAQIRLEDPEANPLVASILNKIQTGFPVGISVGGELKEAHTERHGSKSVRVIDKSDIFEISLVGIPANQDAIVLGSVFKRCVNCAPLKIIRPLGR